MQRQVGVNPLIEQIQMVFYNDLADLTLNLDQITQDNIDDLIITQIQQTIINILDASIHNHDTISLPTGQRLTQENCPIVYLVFFQSLLQLLKFKQNDQQLLLMRGASQLALKVAEQFNQKISQTKKFILEAKGISSIAPSFPEADISVISPALIRQTFYNEMVNQALLATNNGWITLAELEEEEVFIFLALPALTLIEALYQSRNSAGILLLDHQVLTPLNCPDSENFRELFIPLIKKKDEISVLSDNELMAVKFLCLNKDAEFPAALLAYKTARAIQAAATINETASLITRRGVFKQTITQVINFFLEALKGEAPKPSH